MSTPFANLCLIVATLLFCILFLPVFYAKISQSNDQGASGYMIIIVFLIHLVFLGLVSLTYIAIARHGGFDWVSKNLVLRFVLVSVGLLSIVSVSALSVMNRFTPGSVSDGMQQITRFMPVVCLIGVVGLGFILNNNFLRDSIPGWIYKWPMVVVAGFSFISLVWLGIGAFTSGSKSAAESTRQYESSPGIIKDKLSEIEQLDAKEDMVRILELSGSLYPSVVREQASAKIKTNPSWQNDLIRLLENDFALEAFNFLQANEVEDKSIFLEPIRTGIHSVALRIRHDIQATSPSDFYSDMFTDEVNRVLRTVEKFEGMGVDYLPAVKELRYALDEPASKKNVKFDCAATLDQWIQKRLSH